MSTAEMQQLWKEVQAAQAQKQIASDDVVKSGINGVVMTTASDDVEAASPVAIVSGPLSLANGCTAGVGSSTIVGSGDSLLIPGKQSTQVLGI